MQSHCDVKQPIFDAHAEPGSMQPDSEDKLAPLAEIAGESRPLFTAAS